MSNETVTPVVKAPRVLADKSSKMKLPNGLRSPMNESDTAKREFTMLGNKRVQANYTLRLNQSDKNRYAYETTLDFSTCTEDEILQLASVTVRIGIQARLRSMGDSALQLDAMRSINVKADYIDAQRQQVDESIKAIRLLAKQIGCTEDTARSIIATEAAKHAAKK